MPYSSTQNPIRGHRIRMSARPPKKAAVPFAFCLRAKKRRVLEGPMMMVRPIRKRIYFQVMSVRSHQGLDPQLKALWYFLSCIVVGGETWKVWGEGGCGTLAKCVERTFPIASLNGTLIMVSG